MEINNKLIKTDKPLARAYLSTQITGTSTGVWLNGIFDTIQYDTADGFNLADKKYIIPKTGYYKINANAWFPGTVQDKVYMVSIMQDNAELCANWLQSSSNENLIFGTGATAFLVEGTEVYMRLRHNSGSAGVVGYGPAYTFLEIEYLSNS